MRTTRPTRRLATISALTAMVGLLAVAPNAAASITQRVCGIAGVDDGSGYWSRGYCSINNTDTSNAHALKFSLPITTAPGYVSAKTYVSDSGLGGNHVCARIRTFQNSTTYSVGSAVCGNGGGVQQLLLSTLTVPTGGSATVSFSVDPGQTVYDVEIFN